jgi:hypothetical protein
MPSRFCALPGEPDIYRARQQLLKSGTVLRTIAEGLPLLSMCVFDPPAVHKAFYNARAFHQTCRQIYQEAATTLPSNNTWIVFRCFRRLEKTSMNGIVVQTTCAAQMLREHGSCRSMIKRIAIDLDMSCPSDCWSHGLSGAPIPDELIDIEHAVRMLDLLEEI